MEIKSSVGSLNLWFYEERHNAELELGVPGIRVHSCSFVVQKDQALSFCFPNSGTISTSNIDTKIRAQPA